MDKYSAYIYLLFTLKILFILLAIAHIYMKNTNQINSPTDKMIVYWKSRVDFIFTFFMALLLIYLFFPRSNREARVTGETKLLLFLFGIILIITAQWEVFFREAKWFANVQQVLAQRY